MRRSVIVFALLGFAAGASCAPIDFDRDIRPIFSEHCYECHGTDKAKAGLRLNDPKIALGELKSGTRAIIPHDPKNSELLRRVNSTDPDEYMPPKGERLTKIQIDKLQQWIGEGAKWEIHWSYRPITRPPIPKIENRRSKIENDIDAFVLHELEQRNIAPSPPADPFTLIKRLYYDLLGLPAPLGEADRFAADPSDRAYEQLVDNLLANPNFGERWGRHWLDKARYADSDGYEKDGERFDAWKYRDWVINAINADLPFDQFTIKQLAGDLLPNATDDDRLATAFHRQTLTNKEGGVDAEQFRVEAVFDRVETTSAIWLGLTVGCARCHNHKYDAITQREYYQLLAFFDNADEIRHQAPHLQICRWTKYEKEMEAYQPKARRSPVANRKSQIPNRSRRCPTWFADAQQSLDDPFPSAATASRNRFASSAPRKDLGQRADRALRRASRKIWQHSPIHRSQRAPPCSSASSPSGVKNPRTTHIMTRGDFLRPDQSSHSPPPFQYFIHLKATSVLNTQHSILSTRP
jgi:hypothetical protein